MDKKFYVGMRFVVANDEKITSTWDACFAQYQGAVLTVKLLNLEDDTLCLVEENDEEWSIDKVSWTLTAEFYFDTLPRTHTKKGSSSNILLPNEINATNKRFYIGMKFVVGNDEGVSAEQQEYHSIWAGKTLTVKSLTGSDTVCYVRENNKLWTVDDVNWDLTAQLERAKNYSKTPIRFASSSCEAMYLDN